MSFACRVGVTVVPSGVVTFALLMFMVALIYTSDDGLINKPEHIFKPIYHIDQKVIPFEERPPLAKPPDPQPQPERVTSREIFHAPETAFVIPSPRAQPIKPIVRGPIDSDYIPVYVPQPRFPTKALSRGISGYAVVKVTITTTGAVRNPMIVEEFPEGFGFGSSALKAAGKLKYNPRVVEGVAREVPDIHYKFSFKVAN